MDLQQWNLQQWICNNGFAPMDMQQWIGINYKYWKYIFIHQKEGQRWIYKLKNVFVEKFGRSSEQSFQMSQLRPADDVVDYEMPFQLVIPSLSLFLVNKIVFLSNHESVYKKVVHFCYATMDTQQRICNNRYATIDMWQYICNN